MSHEVVILMWTAITVGFVHTILGSDHYLPFVVLAEARQRSSIKTFSITLWILSVIFVFGLCESLIPLVQYPAARVNIASVAIVAVAFGITTIGTMLGLILISQYGLCGSAIEFLGLYLL